MGLTTSSFACRRPAPVLVALFAAGSALAGVTVTLAPPSAPLEPGQAYRLQPEVTGAGDERRCWWAVTENDLLVDQREGVLLVPQHDGGAVLAVQGGDVPRSFLLRVTSRHDPSAFTVVPFAVAAAGAPRAERKDSVPGGWVPVAAPAAPPEPAPPAPELLAWNTRFQLTVADARCIWPSLGDDEPPIISAFAWDPAGPGLAACCELGSGKGLGSAVVRIDLAGAVTVLTSTDPEWHGPAGPWRPPKPAHGAAVALRRSGAVVLADDVNHCLWQIEPDGSQRVLAGGGGADAWALAVAAEAEAEEAAPLAAEQKPFLPSGLAVTGDDEVVFGDPWQGRVCKITPGGRLLAIAGDPRNALEDGERLDLRRRNPASACRLHDPSGIAAGSDGRILVLDSGRDAILVLHPDGTMRAVDGTGLNRHGRPCRPEPVASEGPDDQREIHAVAAVGGGSIRFLRPDGLMGVTGAGGPATLYRTQALWRSDAGPDRWRLPDRRARVGRLCALAVAPGGGVLALESSGGFLYLGPGKGEAVLAAQVEIAAEAAKGGNGERTEAIRRELRAWALDPRATYVAKVLRPAFSRDRPPLSGDPLGVVGQFLVDYPGLALRARLALDAIDARLAQPADAEASAPAADAPFTAED
jgi:hypothetical protein